MDLTDDERNLEVHQLNRRLQSAIDLIDEVDHLLAWGRVFEARTAIDHWRDWRQDK